MIRRGIRSGPCVMLPALRQRWRFLPSHVQHDPGCILGTYKDLAWPECGGNSLTQRSDISMGTKILPDKAREERCSWQRAQQGQMPRGGHKCRVLEEQ